MYDLFLTWSLTMGNFSYLDGRLVGNWYGLQRLGTHCLYLIGSV